MNSSDWLYEQCRREGATDDGVQLTFAHAMQIAGELSRVSAGELATARLERINELESKLEEREAALSERGKQLVLSANARLAAESRLDAVLKRERAAHSVICNHPAEGIGGPGCVCAVVYRGEIDKEREYSARLESRLDAARKALDDFDKNCFDEIDLVSRLDDVIRGSAAGTRQHASDCAVHNEPAYPAGQCNCGVERQESK